MTAAGAGCAAPCDPRHGGAGGNPRDRRRRGAPLRGHVSIGMPPTAADILSEPLVGRLPGRRIPRRRSASSAPIRATCSTGCIGARSMPRSSTTRNPRARCGSSLFLEEALFLIGPGGRGLSAEAPVDFGDLEAPAAAAERGPRAARDPSTAARRSAGFALRRPPWRPTATPRSRTSCGAGMGIHGPPPRAPIRRRAWGGGALRCAASRNPCRSAGWSSHYPSDRPVARLARFAGQVHRGEGGAMVEGGVWAGGPPPEQCGDKSPL